MYQYPRNIFEAVRQERDDFLHNQIELVSGLQFSQYNTIKRIHKYLNDSYVDGDYETINDVTRKKVFWNIGKRHAQIATKQIDIDIKDFLLISENEDTEWNVFLLEKELKTWLKKHRLGKVLNQIAEELPEYGSVVLRKIKNDAQVIDLRYLFNDQSAESLAKGRYTIIKHLMNPVDLREMAGKWDYVDEVIDRYCAHTTKAYEDEGQLKRVMSPEAEVYEAFAIRPRSFLENDGYLIEDGSKADNDYVLTRFIVAGVDDKQRNDQGQIVGENGLILFKEELSELPFKEVHYKRIKGRWLGQGTIEATFEDQRLVNKQKDQEDKASELAALILFQTADELVQRNLLADVDNGEILKSKNGITRLDNKLDLAQFQTIAEAYENHANANTFSSDLLGGELPPASSTATAVVNQIQQAASVYDYKKENLGLFLQEYIDDLVFPELIRDIGQGHSFRLTGSGDELNRIREKVFNYYAKTVVPETGVADELELAALKDKFMQGMAEQGARIWVDVEKDFFKNIDYEVSLEITGEGKNVQAQMTNLQTIMLLFEKSPALLDNPILKRLLYRLMSLMGMSISELENAEVEMSQMRSQQQMQQQQMQEQQMQQAMMQQQAKDQSLQLPQAQPALTSLVQ